jgi:hypothetical protein
MKRPTNSKWPPANCSRVLHSWSYSWLPKRLRQNPWHRSSHRLGFSANELSGPAGKSFLQNWNGSKNRAIPESGRRRILPALARGIENRVIPVKSFLYAAVWRGLRRSSLCGFFQRLCYKMFWVPKLSGAQVGNSRERASARRAPIGGQDGLPDDKDPRVFAPVPS